MGGSSDGGSFTNMLTDPYNPYGVPSFNLDAVDMNDFQEWVENTETAVESSSSSPSDMDTVMSNTTPQQEIISARRSAGLNDDDVCYGMVGSHFLLLCDNLISQTHIPQCKI